MVRHGRHGKAWPGGDGRVNVRRGMARLVAAWQARLGVDWLGRQG